MEPEFIPRLIGLKTIFNHELNKGSQRDIPISSLIPYLIFYHFSMLILQEKNHIHTHQALSGLWYWHMMVLYFFSILRVAISRPSRLLHHYPQSLHTSAFLSPILTINSASTLSQHRSPNNLALNLLIQF